MRKWWRDFKKVKKSELQLVVLVMAFMVALSGTVNVIQAVYNMKLEGRVEQLNSDMATMEGAIMSDSFPPVPLDIDVSPYEALDIISNLKNFGIPKWHRVVEGECLWKIADRYYSDGFMWTRIWALNLDQIENPDLIYPGQIVRIY